MLNLQLAAAARPSPASSACATRSRPSPGCWRRSPASRWCSEQMALIQEMQTDEWWQDVTTPMLENVRRRLRALVKLIEKQKRKPIYTDFEDEIGGETAVDLPGLRHAGQLRAVPRQGPGLPRGARRPHRDPQAADEQGADRRRPRGAGTDAGRERRRQPGRCCRTPKTECHGLGPLRALAGRPGPRGREAGAGRLPRRQDADAPTRSSSST